MRRREFIPLVGGVAITWPHAAVGQQKSVGLPRIGILTAYQEGDTAQPLKPQPLAIALALLLADIVAVLLLQSGGLFFGRRAQRAVAVAAFIVAGSLLLAGAAFAQTVAPTPLGTRTDDAHAVQATAKITFGYVLSGDAAADKVSRQGLIGLNTFLVLHTTVQPGDPFAVNIVTDKIAFFPLLYWPVLSNARPLPEATLTKIDAYMKQGGMIVFDTKDFGQGIPTGRSMRGKVAPPCSACSAASISRAWNPCPSTMC